MLKNATAVRLGTDLYRITLHDTGDVYESPLLYRLLDFGYRLTVDQREYKGDRHATFTMSVTADNPVVV